jgi:hypothetical protein
VRQDPLQGEGAGIATYPVRRDLREATLRAVRNPGTVTLTRDLKPPDQLMQAGHFSGGLEIFK